MTQRQIIRYAAFLAGVLLLIGVFAIAGYFQQFAMRNFASGVIALAGRFLLPVLPGLLIGWSLREPTMRQRRFRTGFFVIFFLLPLLITAFPLINLLLGFPIRWILFPVPSILSFISVSSPVIALLAGIALVFSWRTDPSVPAPSIVTAPPDDVISLDEAVRKMDE